MTKTCIAVIHAKDLFPRVGYQFTIPIVWIFSPMFSCSYLSITSSLAFGLYVLGIRKYLLLCMLPFSCLVAGPCLRLLMLQ